MHLSDNSTKESNVDSTGGIITRQEKIEDFLGRMPGSFQQPDESGVVDMDMSSPTNGLDASGDESDDDIIEQLHKEFVKAQEKDVPQRKVADKSWSSEAYEPPVVVSPRHDINDDPIVMSYNQERRLSAGVKTGASKRKRKSKKGHGGQPFAKEKKDIEVTYLTLFYLYFLLWDNIGGKCG